MWSVDVVENEVNNASFSSSYEQNHFFSFKSVDTRFLWVFWELEIDKLSLLLIDFSCSFQCLRPLVPSYHLPLLICPHIKNELFGILHIIKRPYICPCLVEMIRNLKGILILLLSQCFQTAPYCKSWWCAVPLLCMPHRFQSIHIADDNAAEWRPRQGILQQYCSPTPP